VVNVLAAEVVLADGSIIQASPEENDEIFWALRGAGAGSFFVVTRFKFRLFDDCAIVSCSTLYPIDKTAEVAQHFVKAMQAGPPNVEQRMVFMTGEEGIPLVEMYVTAYAETEDAARELLAPYLSCPVAPHKAPHVYKDTWQNMYDVMIAELPDEHHFAVDNAVVSWDSVMDIMQPLADLYRQTPNPKNMIITAGIGYAGPPIDAAFKTPPYRSSYVGFYSLWKPNDERYVFPGSPASALEGASMAADNQAWVAKGTALVKSVKIGHSLTEVDLRAEGKAEACYTKANWRMLQELQKKYDPNGLFFRYYLQ
jgi:FAD/FMN-containing dehydrogenase